MPDANGKYDMEALHQDIRALTEEQRRLNVEVSHMPEIVVELKGLRIALERISERLIDAVTRTTRDGYVPMSTHIITIVVALGISNGPAILTALRGLLAP